MTTKEKERREDEEQLMRLREMRFPPPTSTSAVIYVIDKSSRSVLLIGNQATGFGGFYYEDEKAEIALQGLVKEWLIKMGAILGPNDIPHCHDSIIRDTHWTYFMTCSRIILPKEALPPNSAWYSKNSLPVSRIRDEDERRLFSEHVLPQI